MRHEKSLHILGKHRMVGGGRDNGEMTAGRGGRSKSVVRGAVDSLMIRDGESPSDDRYSSSKGQ